VAALVSEHQPRVLVLDMSRVPDLEYTALEVMKENEKRAADRGAVLWVVGLNPAALEMVRRSGFADHMGDRLLFNTRAAIARYQELAAANR
jgi:MFS superfamily sulfate permease-like transporter